jgi:RIO1 family
VTIPLIIRQAVEDQLGLVVVDITPFGQQFSASCTPLRITVEGGPATHLFAKLCARSHLRADPWYKLGRELLYGRLEDEISFKSVRRLVEHEDYELRMLRDFGLPVPKPYGTVELTPEREYLLVTEFLENAREISDVEIDDAIIDEALAIIRRLWDVGLAHRDIKPANLLVQDGHVRLIDAFLTEAHPSPWRQAIDLANMLLVLGLLTDPVRVYGRARLVFAEAEIAEAFAAEQGGAMPAQIRQMLRASPTDVRKEFTGLLPERPRAIALQRWTARRIGLLTLALALVGLIGMNLGNAFSNDLAVRTRLSGTRLACTEFESLVVQAQAVPSAAQVPCVRSLPVGWSLTEVAVNDGRAMITLGHDRGGMGALVARFTAGCDPAGSTEVASGTPGVRRFGLAQTLPGRSTAVWYDRLPGGCVTYTLRARADVQAGLADEASTMIGFTSRQVLGQTLERRSGGRLHLDPRAAG